MENDDGARPPEQRVGFPLVRMEPRIFAGNAPPRPHTAPPIVTGTVDVVLDPDVADDLGTISTTRVERLPNGATMILHDIDGNELEIDPTDEIMDAEIGLSQSRIVHSPYYMLTIDDD